jgi:hypothetical protein
MRIHAVFPEEEASAAKELKGIYKLRRKSSITGIIVVLVVLVVVFVSIRVAVGEEYFRLVTWDKIFTSVLSLGVAIIAYRQWIAARHEISIDKYYDRLDVANKRLELLYNGDEHKMDMHVFAQLDKLEYVLVKYSLGYMSSLLARRAVLDFKGYCEDTKFRSLACHWVKEAAYLAKTQEVVALICVAYTPPAVPNEVA